MGVGNSRRTVINCEPSLTVALDEECRTQFRLSVETRTSAYQVRTGDYPDEQLSVYVTARSMAASGRMPPSSHAHAAQPGLPGDAGPSRDRARAQTDRQGDRLGLRACRACRPYDPGKFVDKNLAIG